MRGGGFVCGRTFGVCMEKVVEECSGGREGCTLSSVLVRLIMSSVIILLSTYRVCAPLPL